MPSMCGPVYDHGNGSLTLQSMAVVVDQNMAMLKNWLSMASLIQLYEAKKYGPMLADLLSAEEALTGHPETGLRHVADEMTHFLQRTVIPKGGDPSMWSAYDFESILQPFVDELDVLSHYFSFYLKL